MGSTKALAGADWGSIAMVTLTAAAGIGALAAGFQGWLLRRTLAAERWMLIAAGLLLVYPARAADATGFGLIALVFGLQLLRRKSA
jgi:TRAP-type uncharacterized transport system fused permease subunit